MSLWDGSRPDIYYPEYQDARRPIPQKPGQYHRVVFKTLASTFLSTSLATVGWAILFLNHDECEATEKKDLICEENNICDPCRIILNRNSFMETPYNWEKAG